MTNDTAKTETSASVSFLMSMKERSDLSIKRFLEEIEAEEDIEAAKQADQDLTE